MIQIHARTYQKKNAETEQLKGGCSPISHREGVVVDSKFLHSSARCLGDSTSPPVNTHVPWQQSQLEDMELRGETSRGGGTWKMYQHSQFFFMKLADPPSPSYYIRYVFRVPMFF